MAEGDGPTVYPEQREVRWRTLPELVRELTTTLSTRELRDLVLLLLRYVWNV